MATAVGEPQARLSHLSFVYPFPAMLVAQGRRMDDGDHEASRRCARSPATENAAIKRLWGRVLSPSQPVGGGSEKTVVGEQVGLFSPLGLGLRYCPHRNPSFFFFSFDFLFQARDLHSLECCMVVSSVLAGGGGSPFCFGACSLTNTNEVCTSSLPLSLCVGGAPCMQDNPCVSLLYRFSSKI
jgi:hypothetical protein